ncbi:MAG: hypothetical protein M3P30_12895 [Chloroflexota bacterium]|nr:hypothetical protein [Chloroflexota bacterium]
MGRMVIARYGTALAALVCSLLLAVALVSAVRDTALHPALAAPDGADPVNNDFFVAPVVVQPTDLPFEPRQQTAGATLEQGESAPCGPIGATVWYAFQPQTNGTFEISAAGSDFDTILAVYTLGGGFLPSPPGANLVPVVCNDDSGGPASLVSFPLQRYGSYFIQVGGKNGATGDLALRFACNPSCPPPNDDSTAAQYVNIDSYNPASTTKADTRVATTEAGEPSLCGNIGKTVWYQFYAQQDISIVADTAGSSFDTVLAAYTYEPNFPASPPGGFTPVTCNDNAIGTQSKIVFQVKQGNAYWIQAGGANGASGDLVLNLACDPVCPPRNDGIGGSVDVGFPAEDHITTLGATLEDGEPLPCGSIGATVWYLLYVPGNVNVTVDTAGSDFDTVVAAHEAPYGPPDFRALHGIACNDNGATPQARLTFAASNDRQFVVQVGGHEGATGNLALHIDCDPSPCPPQNDASGNAQYIESTYLPYSFGEDTRGATIEDREQVDCGAMAHTVWFAVHAMSATTVDLNTAGSDFDTAIAVYQTPESLSPPGGGILTQCALSAAGVRADVHVEVATDATIYVQIGSQNGAPGGALSFAATCVPVCPPPNDNSVHAQFVYTPTFEMTVDTTGATLEPGEPRPCGDVGATVWYHIHAPVDARVRISTDGTQFPTVLAVYEPRSPSPEGGADQIGCNDAAGGAALELAITADHDYLVQAGGVGGAKGMLTFHFTCLTECPASGPAIGGGGGFISDGPETGGAITLPNTGSGGYLPDARER